MLRLADIYQERGHNQTVCLCKEGWLADQVRARGFRLLIRPLGHTPDARWIIWLLRNVRSLGIDAVHAHEFAMSVHAGLTARLAGIRAVATIHGKGYYADKLTRRVAVRVVSRVAKLVAVSDDICNYVRAATGVAGNYIRVVPNGVDTTRFKFDPAARERRRASLGVHHGQLLIGAVGSYYAVKGHRYLIEAMSRVRADHPSACLVIAGQGPLERELQDQITSLGLNDRVRLVGYVYDTADFLSALDVFVMPSLSEGMPLALLEAAANGRPIIASNVGGIPELLESGVTGILVQPGDVRQLAESLSTLLGSEVERLRIGASATLAVEQNSSIAMTAERYLQLLSLS
jgi:glycosyltransferase involved in cell wall biosynthesis